MTMPAKKAKPGPKKGVPKPYKRPLDQLFRVRLLAAMRRAGFWNADQTPANAELARKAECERATIGQYLSEDKPRKTIDAPLLLSLCDVLFVTPYYLVFGQGTLDDVPIGKRPMEELRKLPARREAAEETT